MKAAETPMPRRPVLPEDPGPSRGDQAPISVPPESLPPESLPPTSLTPPTLRLTQSSLLAAGPSRVSGWGLTVLALCAFAGAAMIAHPLWMGLAVGTVMAFTSEPLYKWLTRLLRQRRALAALITTITGGLASLGVIAAVTWIAISEVLDLVARLRVPSGSELVGARGRAWMERMHLSPDTIAERLNAALLSFSEKAAGGLAAILATTTSLLLTVVIAFFTMYYVLLEWPTLVRRMQRLLPLDPRHTRALAAEFHDVGRSAFVGTMGTALVQGLFAAVGFMIAGVSQPLLWGTITMLASFLPVIGTAAVWVPVAVATFAMGRTGAAIFVGLWGFLVVTAVADYIVRPRLVGSHTQVHPLPLLISLLGGVEMLGLMGVLIGPVIMALCLAILRIYEAERMRAAGAGEATADDPATSTPPPAVPD